MDLCHGPHRLEEMQPRSVLQLYEIPPDCRKRRMRFSLHARNPDAVLLRQRRAVWSQSIGYARVSTTPRLTQANRLEA